MPHEKISEPFAQCYLFGYEIAGKVNSGDGMPCISNNRITVA